ncbi:hypothetical protein F3N42_08615 [Marinihelvus fidelis]|uniref:AlgX/AlgJ SGNH hydrolase-like domain-containing protein n=1 Tax=Marinihelvus fidelis TaxID=2613842 RepID=A0A5N0TA90_9GAMM|nr:hypothetical protein [Marinihelvus fidelis]KAA9131374.1 hypothetical protein F3N42_08615 [Marinihelvus fidelis]
MTNPRCTFRPAAMAGLLALAAILAIPLVVSAFTDHAGRSLAEQRTLAPLPMLQTGPGLAGYFDAWETFIDDHIGLAGPLNVLYRKGLFYVFRDSPVANVDRGDDGFIFLNSHFRDRPHGRYDYVCRPNTVIARNTAGVLKRIEQASRQAGIELTVATMPSKVLLYPDRIPASVPADIRQACAQLAAEDSLPEMTMAQLDTPGLRYVFPLQPIMERRDEPDFYPPGNFHANSQSSHVFARAVLEAMDIPPGQAFDSGAQPETISHDMHFLGFDRQVTVWRYPYAAFDVTEQLRQPAWVGELFPNVDQYRMYETARPASERVALVLSNSFGDYMSRDLAPGFRRLYQVNMNHMQPDEITAGVKQMIDRLQPNDLVLLAHDGGLPVIKLNRIAPALSNPPPH